MSEAPVAICFVVAAGENGVIGNKGKLPWRMPSDLKLFRALTLGKPIIMGRKTFQSIGKPLDGRDNLVVTRDPTFRAEGILVFPSVEEAIQRAKELAVSRGIAEAMVVGGAEIYRAALPYADRIYLTRVHAFPEGDATFADPDPATWRESRREPVQKHPNNDHEAMLLVFDRLT